MEQKKELVQIVERTIGGVKFKYKQVYYRSKNNPGARFSGKHVKQNLIACNKAYLNAIS